MRKSRFIISKNKQGCEVFHTNDIDGEYFKDRYFLDSCDDPQYFETIEEAAKYVSCIVGHEVEEDFDAIDTALDKYQEEQDNDDVFFSFHEITASDESYYK